MPPASTKKSTPPNNKLIMRRFVNEAWNKKNRNIVHELLTPDFRHYMPGLKDPIIGPKAYQDLIDMFVASFPDVGMKIEEIFGESTRVCMLWTLTGTHHGRFNDKDATGRAIKISGVGVGRIRRGKIEEVISMFDNDEFQTLLTK